MLARLTFYQSDQPVRQFLLDERDHYLIGRDESCAMCFEDGGLSRRHARLFYRDGDWQLADLCSKNGTTIAGRPVSQTTLTGTQWIEFGGIIACFDYVSPEAVAADRERISERWQTSVEVSRELRPTQSPEELLRCVLRSIIEISGTARGFIMLREPDGDFRPDIAHPDTQQGFRGSRSVVERSFAERRPVVCSNVAADAVLGSQASIVGGGISALASVPLRVGRRVLGVIYVDSSEAGKQFTDLDIEILQALADHAALVIGVSRLRDDLVDLSELLPAELERDAAPDPALVDKLQTLLPPLEGGLRGPAAATAAAGADS